MILFHLSPQFLGYYCHQLMTNLGSFCPTKKIDLVLYYSLRTVCQVNTKSTARAKIPHPIPMLSITKSQDILEAVHQTLHSAISQTFLFCKTVNLVSGIALHILTVHTQYLANCPLPFLLKMQILQWYNLTIP